MPITLEELQKQGNVKIIGKVPIEAQPVTPEQKQVGGVFGFGRTLGDALASRNKDVQATQNIPIEEADMANRLTQAIISNRKLGKDTSRLEAALKNLKGNEFNIADIIPSVEKSTKQITGEALSTLGAATLGSSAATSLGRIALGSGMGATFGTGKALEQNNDFEETLKSGLGGAFMGAVLSGVFEGLGYLGGKIVPKVGQKAEKVSADIYSKELQPPTKELANAIKNDFENFGQKVRDVLDDKGRPYYVGNYENLLKKATKDLRIQGVKLKNRLLEYSDVVIKRNEVIGRLVDDLKDIYGSLTTNQIKTITNFVKKLPNEMKPIEALKYKRFFDDLISNTDWNRLTMGDAQLSFSTQVKYIIRDNLRRSINLSTADSEIEQINNRMGIAIELRDLISKQMATRVKYKTLSGSNPFGRMLGKFFDDFILNPAVTTRTSQALKKIQPKPFSPKFKPAMTVGKNIIIKQTSEQKQE